MQSGRLAELGQFAAHLMHGVNNTFSVILSASNMLQHSAESPSAVRDYAERIQRAVERGATTALRLGHFIRQVPLDMNSAERVDLAALVASVAETSGLMESCGSGRRVNLCVITETQSAVVVRGISVELREALTQLVHNSMEAMPDGGTLTVRCREEVDHALVEVEDTGAGMTEQVLQHVFEPFFTTRHGNDRGLGLAQVYGIARRHHGLVSIDSQVGRGTTVSVRLPRSLDAAAAVQRPISDSVPSKRILIVEDQDDVQLLLRRVLEGEGYIVDVAATVGEARELLEVLAPPAYDLLLADVVLSDGSGLVLAHDISARHPTLRIGLLTGGDLQTESSDMKVVEFVLRKPWQLQELKSRVAGRTSAATHCG